MVNGHHDIERARSALLYIDPGCPREEWFKAAAAAKVIGVDFETFHDWSAQGGNYKSEADCRAVWRSIHADGGISAGTLFHLAREAGWRDETKGGPDDRLTDALARDGPPHPRIDRDALWDACKPATDGHEYIARKLGLPDGLRVYSGDLVIAGQRCDRALVLPCFTLAGGLATLQFVPPQGKKVFLPGPHLPADASLIVGGPIQDGKPVYLVEGIGQAWSAHQATSCPAVVCFGWGRVKGVGVVIRAKYPGAKLVIVPDAGKEPEAEAIAREVHGAWASMPPGSPKNYDINDYHHERGLAGVATLLGQAQEPLQRFRLLTPEDLATLPPVRWRVRGVLPEAGIAAVYGPPACGKSFLVLDLLAHIAAGGPWFDCRCYPAPVIYVGLEGEAGIAQRVQAWETKHGERPHSLRVTLAPFDIRRAEDRAELVESIQAAGLAGGVVCIDTLNRAAPGMDENDSADMGEAIAGAKALQAALGGVILLVHHSGKDSTKGLRGHSSLLAALDVSVEVSRTGDRREWRVGKAKDGEDGKAHPFRLAVTELGENEEGEPVTSCVVVPVDEAANAVPRVKVPAGGNQRIVWDALGELFRATGAVPPEGAPKGLPPGRPCLRLEDAIAKVRDRLLVEPARKTERTRQAIAGLVSKGLVEHQEGFIWCK